MKPAKAVPCVAEWMTDMMESSAVMGALLSIIHPQMFHAAMQAFSTLANHPELSKEGPEVLEVLGRWSSPFSGYSIISNRNTPLHRDTSAPPECYDLLATFGNYTNGTMKLPGVGVTLDYPPGSLVALCGKVIPHAVPEVNGNRVCIAHYMRKNVHERLQVPPVGWMTLDSYS
jgi:Oxygenase domain of the 2OGFeDO superfamily